MVETILEGLADAKQLFEHGTMEDRTWLVRAFVEGLTIDGSSQSGELRMKRLPVPEPRSTGSSFEMVAGGPLRSPTEESGEGDGGYPAGLHGPGEGVRACGGRAGGTELGRSPT